MIVGIWPKASEKAGAPRVPPLTFAMLDKIKAE